LETNALALRDEGNHIEMDENTGAAVHDVNHDDLENHVNALTELKAHVFLKSSIIAAQCELTRKESMQLAANTLSGKKLIKAKQHVIAMPPVLDNTKYFGPDQRSRPF
jgi:hypothetical protein